LNVREVTITCLGFINPKHIAKLMKENISFVSTDYIYITDIRLLASVPAVQMMVCFPLANTYSELCLKRNLAIT